MNNELKELAWATKYLKVGLNSDLARLLAEHQWDGRRVWEPKQFDKTRRYSKKNLGDKYGVSYETTYFVNKGLALLFKGKVEKAKKLLEKAGKITPYTGDRGYSDKSIRLLIENAEEIKEAMHKVYYG